MTICRPRNSRATAGLKAVSRRDQQIHLVAAAALWCLGAMNVMSAAFTLVVHPHHRGGLISRRRQDWDAFIRPIIEDGTFKTRFRMDHKEFKTLYDCCGDAWLAMKEKGEVVTGE